MSNVWTLTGLLASGIFTKDENLKRHGLEFVVRNLPSDTKTMSSWFTRISGVLLPCSCNRLHLLSLDTSNWTCLDLTRSGDAKLLTNVQLCPNPQCIGPHLLFFIRAVEQIRAVGKHLPWCSPFYGCRRSSAEKDASLFIKGSTAGQTETPQNVPKVTLIWKTGTDACATMHVRRENSQ